MSAQAGFAAAAAIGGYYHGAASQGFGKLRQCDIIQETVLFVPQHNFRYCQQVALQTTLALLDDIGAGH